MNGRLELCSSFFFAFWILFFVRLRMAIGGQVQQARWGKTTLELPAGQYRLEVYYPYFVLRKAGLATMDVRIEPACCTLVHYRAPWFIFLWGGTLRLAGVHALGPPPPVVR